MLTRVLAIASYDRGRVVPDRIGRDDAAGTRLVARCVAVYRDGAGLRREQLHGALERLVVHGDSLGRARARALAKLLDDESRWRTGSDGRAARRRLLLFSMAAHHHPLRRASAGAAETDVAEAGEREVKEWLAARLGTPWDTLREELFCDIPAHNRLVRLGAHVDVPWLVARYDLAQVQAGLFRAERARIEAGGGWKDIVRAVKLARLLVDIRRIGVERYRFDLTGPATALRRTTWYGARLARLVPTLAGLDGWRLDAAVVLSNGRRGTLTVRAEDGLWTDRSPPAAFDSGVEAAFASSFGARRDGWRLVREGVVLHRGQTVFFPDFTFRHDDGMEVHLEIVGFWTDDYLARKREKLSRFAGAGVLIAIPERSAGRFVAPGDDVIRYRTRLRLEPVLARLAAIRSARRARTRSSAVRGGSSAGDAAR